MIACSVPRRWPRLLLFFLLLAALPLLARAQETADDRVEISVARFYNPNAPQIATTKRLLELMQEDPSMIVTQWGGLELPGGAGRAPIMMAIAGQTAPDIMESWFHIVGNDIRQGFLYPLNEWIGDDEDGNGMVDPDEAKWDRWKTIPPLWRQVVTRDGKVYGIPQAAKYYMGVIYRTDLVRAAGLDPADTPETWDELVYWCERLTDPAKDIPGAVIKRGQRGMALVPYGFCWLPWMQSAGGDPIVQVRRGPDGREFVLPPDTFGKIVVDGVDLTDAKVEWRANFADPAGVAAAGLYHRLRWMKWMVDPETGEPIDLTPADIKAKSVTVGDRVVTFTQQDVITGVARGQVTGQRGTNAWDLMGRGEVAMVTWFVQDLNSVGNSVGLDPDLLSWFPFPAGPGPKGRRVVQVQNHYAVMCEGVGRRPQAERDKVWKALTAITDSEVADEAIRNKVLAGLARFVNPEDLERLGFEDYLKDIPNSIRDNYAAISRGEIQSFTEPYMGFWVTMDGALNREVTSLVISQEGENFDYQGALEKVQKDANSGLMFGRSEEELNTYRPTARIVFTLLVVFMVVCLVLIIHSWVKSSRREARTKSVYSGALPLLIMGPALLLIGLWRYYPLLRGMVMAFQDYRIAGETTFVGLDNFISLALDGSFWMSLVRTLYFVALNMVLAFCAPIALALLLSEVPKGKYLYRTLFFLPQITSGLVIALLWKLMYEPTPQGFLNQLLLILNNPVVGTVARFGGLIVWFGFLGLIIYYTAIKREGFTPTAQVVWSTLAGIGVVVSVVGLGLWIWPALTDPAVTFGAKLHGLIEGVGVDSQTWLQDPKMAMLCCVVPTVWATMGMASLIYLAALKSVPDELYEAADVDGAGIVTKLRTITLPTLMPLVIINFVGAFIGTFQNMGNIFLMTFGGPGESTMVLGMRIWVEAYNNLRFSMATSMAWVLGAMLIAFTYVQIQFLKRVEFKKADWD